MAALDGDSAPWVQHERVVNAISLQNPYHPLIVVTPERFDMIRREESSIEVQDTAVGRGGGGLSEPTYTHIIATARAKTQEAHAMPCHDKTKYTCIITSLTKTFQHTK